MSHNGSTLMHPPSARVAVAMLLVFAAPLSGCNDERPASEPRPAAREQAAHSHANPEETCFICDPSKRESDRLWCREHGRYEDRCWECQPQLRDPNRPYCEEHGLYEDECFLCDPSRVQAAAETIERSAGSSADQLFCNEHQVPEHQCGICQPQRAGQLDVGESLLIRMASDRSAELAGISTVRPIQARAITSLSLLGEVQFDGNRLAEVTALSGGVLATVNADLGETVEAGEVLAVVHSPGAAEARAEYLATRADLRMRRSASERQERLFADSIGSRREMEEASASYRRAQVAARLARQRLLNLGFTEDEVAATRDAGSDLPLRAPLGGTVVKRVAVTGEAVETGDALFEIADLGAMWVDLAVPEEHAGRIAVGAPIDVTVRGHGSGSQTGRVTWVGPSVDQRTRMVRARGVVPNDEGRLRDGMFADVAVTLDVHPGALRLPADAVHRLDSLRFVFVRLEPDLFAARRVELGDRLPSDEIIVHGGVDPADEVVSQGSFVIKSALLASRLGAGCTDD